MVFYKRYKNFLLPSYQSNSKVAAILHVIGPFFIIYFFISSGPDTLPYDFTYHLSYSSFIRLIYFKYYIITLFIYLFYLSPTVKTRITITVFTILNGRTIEIFRVFTFIYLTSHFRYTFSIIIKINL